MSKYKKSRYKISMKMIRQYREGYLIYKGDKVLPNTWAEIKCNNYNVEYKGEACSEYFLLGALIYCSKYTHDVYFSLYKLWLKCPNIGTWNNILTESVDIVEMFHNDTGNEWFNYVLDEGLVLDKLYTYQINNIDMLSNVVDDSYVLDDDSYALNEEAYCNNIDMLSNVVDEDAYCDNIIDLEKAANIELAKKQSIASLRDNYIQAMSIWKTSCHELKLGGYDCAVDNHPAYTKWRGMLNRAYGASSSKWYDDVTVSESFKHYHIFKQWYLTQYIEEGWELDKDLLVKGNKIYCASRCCFLPKEINSAIAINRGLIPMLAEKYRKVLNNDIYNALSLFTVN